MLTLAAFLILTALCYLGCQSTGEDAISHMNLSNIKLMASYSQWNENHSKARVELTFSNLTTKPVIVVLPCALNERSEIFASTSRPVLVLIAREPNTNKEEAFIWTDLGKSEYRQPKTVILRPGESASKSYELDSFYRWGPCGPDKWANILNYLQVGDREIEMRAVIAYSDIEPTKGDHIESAPVTLKCAFPAWLFR